MAVEYPRLSGDLNAYEFYVEVHLQWLCRDCGHYVVCTDDIREDEAEAPYGGWATRKAKEAMTEGWYVRPLNEEGALFAMECFCSKCAKKSGLVIREN